VAAESRHFGVAGYPVAHSRSPQLHAAAYAALGIDADYQRLPIPPELFDETVRALPGSGFAGINVTIPHKHAALEIADVASASARAIGAANTLTFADESIRADNTDAPGLIAALDRSVQGLRALVLGAGGTARAAAWALQDADASVSIWNRTTERAEALAESLGVEALVDPATADYDLIVNTTSAGMDAGESLDSVLDALNVDLAVVKSGATIVDFVYREGGSPLTVAARERGIAVVDGNELLVRQGALSFEIWLEQAAPLDAMRAALLS
jgi:shikimate dehydrogenase